MAKPNYSFEKRQKEIAKKKKKEEKRLRKQTPNQVTNAEPTESTEPPASDAKKDIVWPTQEKPKAE